MRTEAEVQDMPVRRKTEIEVAAEKAYNLAFSKCIELLDRGYNVEHLREIGRKIGAAGPPRTLN